MWANITAQINIKQVDVEEKKDEIGLVEMKYRVHTSHNDDTECQENCQILDIKEYRACYRDALLEHAFLPASAEMIHNRFNQLTTLVLSLQAMKSTRHFANIKFPQDSVTSESVFVTWPESFSLMNAKLANNENLTAEDKQNFYSFIEENFTTSLDANYVSENFDFPHETSEKIVKLAKVHQHHPPSAGTRFQNEAKNNFPSNGTLMKETLKGEVTDHQAMLTEWERVKDAFLIKLNGLPKANFSSNSEVKLDDFLSSLEELAGYSLVEHNGIIRLSLPMFPMFMLKIDDILRSNLDNNEYSKLSAIYHRAITVASQPGIEVVMKRPCLRDCSTNSYSPLVLLAAESPVDINICGRNQKETVDLVVQEDATIPDELERFAADHSEVSMEEAIWLSDPKKRMVRRNTRCTFLNVLDSTRLKFREAVVPNMLLNFTDVDNGKLMERILQVHDHYLVRQGNDGACLDQFATNYTDDLSEDKEREAEEEQEAPWVVTCKDYPGPPEKLKPEIVLNSGKRLRLRNIPKVLSYQTPEEETEDFIRLNVILYHPHRTYEEVTGNMDEMREIFLAKDNNPKRDGRNREMTKLETVRSKLHPQSNQRLWRKLFGPSEED